MTYDQSVALRAYGQQHLVTPNLELDRLVSRDLVFQRAYCQQAVWTITRQLHDQPQAAPHTGLRQRRRLCDSCFGRAAACTPGDDRTHT